MGYATSSVRRVPVGLICLFLAQGARASEPGARPQPTGRATMPTKVICLDGEQWRLATDPRNVGRAEKWPEAPRPEAKPTRVPWIIQDVFPDYHGVAWYWRDVTPPANPHADGRALLRFWAVDYKADVWLNGIHVGEHEGGESVFVLDVTAALKPGVANCLAVRVLNPTHEPIDGIVLRETAHRNKDYPIRPGSDSNHGGIVDSVELLLAPPVRIADLFVRPDPRTGAIRVATTVVNATGGQAEGHLELSVAPAAAGRTLAATRLERRLPPGETAVRAELIVEQPRLWQLDDPFLYRVTARVWQDASPSFDEASTRCGFRDFRFERGHFRLNGVRLFLRSSHTGNCCPIGMHLPHQPGLLRRDLLNVKAMGFNAIRFIAGVAQRTQLDLCDELGLLVYEEPYAAWLLSPSPRMAERYDESLFGMVRRDRNHPSVVIWGLLNETGDNPVLRHAAAILPRLRALDDSRMVFLNSGRWDLTGRAAIGGLQAWRSAKLVDPNVTHNPTPGTLTGLGVTWVPGQLAFHPGPKGEYSVVRWTSPTDGEVQLSAAFASIAEKATTDVHVLHRGASKFRAFINLRGSGPTARYAARLAVTRGDTLDCVVGFGNGNYGGDSTGLRFAIKARDGRTWDAAADFSVEKNPNGPWSYGVLAHGPAPDARTFRLYAVGETVPAAALGALSNPGSAKWEDVLYDHHPYPRVPHTADTIRLLRSLSRRDQPVFISEYGIGSSMHLARVVRQYEQLGKAESEGGHLYRGFLDQFLADWTRWRLAEAFASPDDYFNRTIAKMAGQRLLGLNAIRANPRCVGHSLTGTVDQGWTGEGLTTTFRELKPGTVDALFDGLAPLRLCLFAEPPNVYRGSTVRLEAVLANEDALRPGEYPLRLQVVGPGSARAFDRTIAVTIPDGEPPFAIPLFAEDVAIEGAAGSYRFLASFERGAAATGGQASFRVFGPAQMPSVDGEVVLWGSDVGLQKWLTDRGIRTRPFDPARQPGREVILASTAPPPGGAEPFRQLVRHVARGSTAVFLSPQVFRKGDHPVGWLPLPKKGTLTAVRGWLYLKDEWAKPHPIFDGLPTGLMDYAVYRDIIPDELLAGQDPPAEAVAGAFKTSQGYAAGLMLAAHTLGAGRFVLNTLRIRESLGRDPVAERLLRNLLRYAATGADKPPADPPAGLDALLTALGY